jgi:hypothetical protein
MPPFYYLATLDLSFEMQLGIQEAFLDHWSLHGPLPTSVRVRTTLQGLFGYPTISLQALEGRNSNSCLVLMKLRAQTNSWFSIGICSRKSNCGHIEPHYL